jgi:hypothetical protein
MPIDVESVISLYAKEAAACYGSGLVSQLEHALQATQLALAEGASAELSAAAFLHDIGHLVAGRSHARGRIGARPGSYRRASAGSRRLSQNGDRGRLRSAGRRALQPVEEARGFSSIQSMRPLQGPFLESLAPLLHVVH